MSVRLADRESNAKPVEPAVAHAESTHAACNAQAVEAAFEVVVRVVATSSETPREAWWLADGW